MYARYQKAGRLSHAARVTGWTLAAACALGGVVRAADVTASKPGEWPSFRGADRSGVSQEKGLLKSWPAGGPKLLWKTPNLGEGHSSIAIANGRIYSMGLRGDNEVVWALNVKDGQEAWSTKIAAGGSLRGRQGGFGSRCTPTIVGNRLYAEGVQGDVICLDVANGKQIWKKNLVTDFGGSVPTWGYSESPLVDGDKVIVTPGGSTPIVALKAATGEVVWKAQIPEGDDAHYASAIIADVDGQREYIQLLSGALVGVDAKTGKQLWRYKAPANGTANCSAPIYRDNMAFAATGYRTGGGAVKLTASSSGVTAKEVYFTKQMQNHHGGVVLVGDYLYGCDERYLTCINFKTGEVRWAATAEQSVGKGSVTYADGCLYVRSERGPVALVEANPREYVEKGRFDQPDRSRAAAWAYPVVCDGKLYLRDQDNLFCYDVKAK